MKKTLREVWKEIASRAKRAGESQRIAEESARFKAVCAYLDEKCNAAARMGKKRVTIRKTFLVSGKNPKEAIWGRGADVRRYAILRNLQATSNLDCSVNLINPLL